MGCLNDGPEVLLLFLKIRFGLVPRSPEESFFLDKADEELLNQKIRSEIVTLDGRGEHPMAGVIECTQFRGDQT